MSRKKKKERRRGNRRENRHERRQQQHAGGGEWDCVSIPDGLEVFRPEKGETYNIDVIPYIVGRNNKNADEGDEYFELSYPVYRDLGIDEKRFIAIKELCDERDPVAEHFAKLRRDDADWDDMKLFKPVWRQLMLIFVHEQADKGLQLFEGAYGTFGELLDEEIKANEEEYVDNFDDPEGGATLEVRFKAKNIGQQNPWVLASKINFEERENGFDADGDDDLAEKILNQAEGICLDECLKIPTYDQLKAALDGQPEGHEQEDADEDDEEPKKGRRTRKAKTKEPEEPEPEPEPEGDPDEDEDVPMFHKGDVVEHEEHGTSKILRISKDGTKCSLRDEDDEVQKNVPLTELSPADPEPEPEDEKPKAKGKGKNKGKKKDPDPDPEPEPEKGEEKEGGDSDGDDWDDDWDD